MAISGTTTYVSYDGNNSTSTYYALTGIELGATTDIQGKAILKTTGAVTSLTNAVDFTVDLTNGVQTTAAWDNTYEMVFWRDTPATQPTDLSATEVVAGSSIETADDRIVRILQEVHDEVQRAIRMPEGDDQTAATEVTEAVARALTPYLRFNSTTGALELVSLSALASAISSNLGLASGAVGDGGMQTFQDSTERGNATPDREGQIGVQLDDDSVWVAVGTSAGDFSQGAVVLNYLPLAGGTMTGALTLGANMDANFWDIENLAQVTTTAGGTFNAAAAATLGEGFLRMTGGSQAVSAAGDGKIYFDSGSNTFKVSENGGGYVNLLSASATFADMAVSADVASDTITATTYLNTLANATIIDAGLTGGDFTVDDTNKRVTYTGATTQTFVVTGAFSMISTKSNTVASFRLAKNGTTDANTQVDRKIGTGSDVGAAAIQGTFSLAQNDYIELWGTLAASTSDTITVQTLNLSIVSV